MTDELFIETKTEYVDMVKRMMLDLGCISPHIALFGIYKSKDQPAIIHVAIPKKYMASDNMKDQFIDKVVPAIKKEMTEDFGIDAVGSATEGWLRMAEPSELSGMKDYKDLPVKMEVVIVTIESATRHDTIIMEITRKGKQVNADGDLVDSIELVKVIDTENTVAGTGRFDDLFRKFSEV